MNEKWRMFIFLWPLCVCWGRSSDMFSVSIKSKKQNCLLSSWINKSCFHISHPVCVSVVCWRRNSTLYWRLWTRSLRPPPCTPQLLPPPSQRSRRRQRELYCLLQFIIIPLLLLLTSPAHHGQTVPLLLQQLPSLNLESSWCWEPTAWRKPSDRSSSTQRKVQQIGRQTDRSHRETDRQAGQCKFQNEVCVVCFSAVDEQNAQTQQQLFTLGRAEEEEGLVEEEEEEEVEEDKLSLQSAYSIKQRNTRRGQWYCCCNSYCYDLQGSGSLQSSSDSKSNTFTYKQEMQRQLLHVNLNKSHAKQCTGFQDFKGKFQCKCKCKRPLKVF